MRKIKTYRLGLLAAAGAAVMALGAPALAQQNQVVFTKAVVPFDESVQVLGAAPSQATIHFQIVLKLRDYAGLANSNAEGRVMTVAEMRRDHLPTRADYDKVLNWATQAGLAIDKTSSSRMSVQVSGDVAQVSRVIGVHFSRIRSEGKDYIAADSAPSLPGSIAPAVHTIRGLQPHLHAYKIGNAVHTDSATSPPFWAQAFITGYSATGLGNGGAGATTAIVIDTFPHVDDLKQYWSITGSPQKIKNFTFIQAVEGDLPPLTGEESMDAQVASSVAPRSKVRVYASQNLSFDSLDVTYQRLINDMTDGVKITQVSISLGACEHKIAEKAPDILTTDDNFFAVMSGMGASVFVSTGDSGSRECGQKTTSFFATSPNVTGAGGTTLSLNGAGETTAESGWSGSGGGLSSFFDRPQYQKSLGLGFKKRAIPDISADANPQTGALVVINGDATNTIGGTSLSAPILAGLTALANADRIANHKKPLGLLNSRIYKIPATNFRDITSGNNGDYSAVAGYDLVTGLGAPIMSELIPTLTAQK